jgi:hypothetical protein
LNSLVEVGPLLEAPDSTAAQIHLQVTHRNKEMSEWQWKTFELRVNVLDVEGGIECFGLST